MRVPEPPSDLGFTGIDMWNELLAGRSLGATQLALVHNLCRTADNLDAFAAQYAGELVVLDDAGTAVANPLLVEFRQQLLALRQIMKDLGLMELGDAAGASRESKWDAWAASKGFETR